MALAPQVYGPDGLLRGTLIFTTTREHRFFLGVMSSDTVDMEVSINGGGFTTDPNFISFEDTSWVVPNPSAYPDGLDLLSGRNTIEVRAISATGATSAPASVIVTLTQESDLGVLASPPTNFSLTQEDNAVLLKVEGLTTSGFQGVNFYASNSEGGGATGYSQLNVNLISTGTVEQEFTSLASLAVESDILVDGNGDPVADPMYYRVIGQQENEAAVVLQQDFNERYEIPETARQVLTTVNIQTVRTTSFFSFLHNRSFGQTSDPPTVPNNTFSATPFEIPLYYVVTAVFYDSTTNIEYESSFSAEVVGHPIKVTATIGSFPVVSRNQIVKDFMVSVFRSNPQIRMEEGSTLREVVIDPFSSEAERLRFIVDFLHRARAPTLLLAVDDPQNTGVSSPVASTPYKLALKQAFRLQSNGDVQSLIDSAFDAYASNFGVFRRSGTAAQGYVTFFTKTRPTRTLLFPLGTIVSGGSSDFRTTRAVQIPLNQVASYYNPVNGRYQITVPVRAVKGGSAGNVGVGQIRRVVSSIPGTSVVNGGAMFGGTDQETNLILTERARRRLASVDAGTKQGYLNTAADVPGVLKANVVGAGDPLMQRDLDSTGTHRGGKVDVWVQGTSLATVTDTFAFSFVIAQNIQFEVVGLPANLEFKAVDPNLSSEDPIVEMLDFPDAGYEFKNATTGQVFDLTGVLITSFNTIKLSASVPQPGVTLTDVVLGSYRRRVGNTFTFTRQPVTEVTAVEGVVSGVLPTTAFTLTHPDPPLVKGRSSLASDYLTIISYTDATTGAQVPSGDLIAVTNELHVLVGEYPESVDNLGAVFLTVHVYNSDRTVEYRGPDDSSGISDYSIGLGTQTTPLTITRVSTGNIPNGATVSIDYSHDENFTVTYTTNLIVAVTQDAIEAMRHATADVIAKDAVPAPLDLEATVILNKGSDASDVDPTLRTNLTNFITNLRLGDPVRQSDVINVIETTNGVSYVIVPLTKMVRAEGSQVVRESLTTDLSSEVTQIPTLSTESVLVWLVEDSLMNATTNGGGSATEFRGVTQDDVDLTLMDASLPLSALGLGVGRTYIIGAAGVVIQGLTDDTTLLLDGFTTAASRAAQRALLTGNRILVSTTPSDSPINHSYAVTYIVGPDSGAKDIDPGAAEYITPGTWLFTYDQDV